MVQVAQLQGIICADIAQQDAASRGTEAHAQILDRWNVCRWLPDELAAMQWNENDNEHTLKYAAYYYYYYYY